MELAEKKAFSDCDQPYVGDLARFCQGASDPNRYFVALNVAAAKVQTKFSISGTGVLDAINAFDRAEVARVNMGQINAIEVSSFCGPQAYFWGHDVARCENESQPMFHVRQWDDVNLPVYDGEPLIDAAAALFGTMDRKLFPLAPGTLCPVAIKSITTSEPGKIYAACGVGFRKSDENCATSLMEDVGRFPENTNLGPNERKSSVIESVAGSVMAVAENQRIRLSSIHVAYTELSIGVGETGCALLMLPYFSLARDAFPPEGIEGLKNMSLSDWKKVQHPADR